MMEYKMPSRPVGQLGKVLDGCEQIRDVYR
jgi:hypothetical protein